MSLPGWKQVTIQAVAVYTGPVAELLVEDALAKCGVSEADMTAGTYIRFLQKLHDELPTEIDRDKTCHAVRKIVLAKYGF